MATDKDKENYIRVLTIVQYLIDVLTTVMGSVALTSIFLILFGLVMGPFQPVGGILFLLSTLVILFLRILSEAIRVYRLEVESRVSHRFDSPVPSASETTLRVSPIHSQRESPTSHTRRRHRRSLPGQKTVIEQLQDPVYAPIQKLGSVHIPENQTGLPPVSPVSSGEESNKSSQALDASLQRLQMCVSDKSLTPGSGSILKSRHPTGDAMILEPQSNAPDISSISDTGNGQKSRHSSDKTDETPDPKTNIPDI